MTISDSSILRKKDSDWIYTHLLYLVVITGLIMFVVLVGCEKNDVKKTSKSEDEVKPEVSVPTKPSTKNNEAIEPESNDSTEKNEFEPIKPEIITLTPESILEEFITRECFSAQSPWLVAQGIKALGAESKMPSGTNTVEFLMQFIENVKIKGENYRKFRTGAYFDTLTDANPNMLLKILMDANVDGNKEFKTKHGKISLKMLINDAKMLFRPRIADKIEYPNLDWTLEVFAEVLDPKQFQWINAYGDKVDYVETIEKNFAVLEKHMKNIEQDFDNKRRITSASMIQGDINGGAHLFISSAKAIHNGFGSDSMKKRLKKQAELVFYRLKYEPLLYQALHKGVMEKNISDNVRRTRLWMFNRDILKFYAYQLESAQLIKKFDIIPIDDKKNIILNKAYENLRNLILFMHVENIFKWINKWNVKGTDKTMQKHIIYHDIVADSCQTYKVLKQK